MTNKKFYEVLGDVSEKHITKAREYRKTNRPAWLKWGAAAACLCLLIGLAVPVLTPNGGPSQDDPLHPLGIIEYNGAYYECIDMTDTKTLDDFHLPHEITAEMIGAPLGTSPDPTGERTEWTFRQYVPYADVAAITGELKQERAQRAVYILENGEACTFAVFCNFIGFDSNTHTEASEMFAVYGVDEAGDIAGITIGNDTFTDAGRIRSLFDNLINSYAMGNDDYQNSVFSGMSEEKQQALSVELADSMIEITIETAAGIAINHLCYYPTINYVSWALNYYQLDTPIV